MNIAEQIKKIVVRAREVQPLLAAASCKIKDDAINFAAEEIIKNKDFILKANASDLAALSDGVSAPMRDRLTLNSARIDAMAEGLNTVAALPDPVGRSLKSWRAPRGFNIEQVSTPIGVACVIYEARPNVTADAAALCLKAGNAVILRGGSDSLRSSLAILECMHKGFERAGLEKDCVQMVAVGSREAVGELLKLDAYIDVVIPRGGKSLIERISGESKIPLFKHLNGVCHTYVHKSAEIDMAVNVAINAKMRRTSICGATETLLLDKELDAGDAKKIIDAFIAAGCEVRGDAFVQALNSGVKPALEEDWSAEYLDAVISAKQVDGVKAAAAHIAKYGSSHTESIIASDAAAAEEFLNLVDSSVVMHNVSTQFCDGGEFGFGGEIGISTGRLHARGPVALEQLTIFKYKVRGDGNIRP